MPRDPLFPQLPLLVPIVMFFWISPSSASNKIQDRSCNTILAGLNPSNHADSNESPATGEELREIASLLSKLYRSIGNLEHPKAMSVGFVNFGGQFDCEKNHLTTTYTRATPESPRLATPSILWHEAGHGLFDFNLMKAIQRELEAAQLGDLESLHRTRQHLETDLLTALHTYLGTDDPSGKYNTPKKGTRTAMADVTLAEKKLNDFDESLRIKSAGVDWTYVSGRNSTNGYHGYTELFTYLLEAIHTGDPSAHYNHQMADLSNPPKRDSEGNVILTIQFDRKKYAAIDFNQGVPLEGWEETDAHLLFGPTVRFIGLHYLKNPRFKGQEHVILEKCFQAMVNDLKKHSKTKLEVEPENVEAFNRSLIEELRNEFGYP